MRVSVKQKCFQFVLESVQRGIRRPQIVWQTNYLCKNNKQLITRGRWKCGSRQQRWKMQEWKIQER